MQRLVTTHVGVTNRGLNDIKLEVANQKQSLTDLGDVFSDWAVETAKQLNVRLDKAENAATELGQRVQQQADVITGDVFPRLLNLESQWLGGERGGPIPTPITPEAMHCIRVLAQVQDLVTDKNFVLKTNNETLKKIQGSNPHEECLKKITDERLKAEFISAFGQFSTDDPDERSDRLLLIQQLNAKLIRFFCEPRTA
jgi:hypothetical protein